MIKGTNILLTENQVTMSAKGFNTVDSNQWTFLKTCNHWMKRKNSNANTFDTVFYLYGKVTEKKLVEAFKELFESSDEISDTGPKIINFDFAQFDFKWDGLKEIAEEIFNLLKTRSKLELLCSSKHSHEHLLLLLLKFELAHFHCNRFFVFGSEMGCFEYLKSKTKQKYSF